MTTDKRAPDHKTKWLSPWLLLAACALGLLLVLADTQLEARAAPDLAPLEGASGALASQWRAEGPVVDGERDDIWAAAPALRVPMTLGRAGSVQMLEVELASLHTDERIYFWARWPETQPVSPPGVLRNKLTLHFEIPEPYPGARDVTCLVACHTAFVDADNQVAHLLGETIPPGRTDPLPAAGRWEAGTWQMEWSRPLVAENGFDVQFSDLSRSYPFFVKLFAWAEGQADPISADHMLIFQP